MDISFKKSGLKLKEVKFREGEDKNGQSKKYFKCAFVDDSSGDYIELPMGEQLAEHVKMIEDSSPNYNFTVSVKFSSFYDQQKNVFGFKPWCFNAE